MTKDQLTKLITEVLGERCPEHHEQCMTCAAWWMFDRLSDEPKADWRIGPDTSAPGCKCVVSGNLVNSANCPIHGLPQNPSEPEAEQGAIGRLPLTMEFMTIENAIVNGHVIQWACSCAHATKEEHESSLNRDG